MSNDKKKEAMPITDTILAIIGGGHPNWIVGPLDEVERIAKENGIDVKDLNITPVSKLEEK
jgi:hypothetical protein